MEKIFTPKPFLQNTNDNYLVTLAISEKQMNKFLLKNKISSDEIINPYN